MSVSVNRVLRRVLAAENENESPVEVDTLKEEDIKENKVKATATTQYFYFYDINKASSISFGDLTELVIQDPHRSSKILNTGWTGEHGDHFKWTGVVVKTNVLGENQITDKGFVAYYSPLSRDGSRVAGKDKIILDANLKKDPQYKDPNSIPIDSFLKANNVFIEGKEVPNFIYIEKRPGNGFFHEASEGIEAKIATILRDNFGGTANSFNEWKGKIFANYRMWVDRSNIDQLRYPDLDVPKDYLGDAASKKALEEKVRANSNMKDYSIEKYSGGPDNSFPTEDKPETLADKNKASDGPFEAVDEQRKQASDKKEDGGKSYDKEPYGGGFSIMQNLVKDQKDSMKIRQAANRVVMAAMSGYSSGGSSKSKGKVTENDVTNLKNYNDQVERYNKLNKHADEVDESGETGVIEDPSGLHKQSSVHNVISKYLK